MEQDLWDADHEDGPSVHNGKPAPMTPAGGGRPEQRTTRSTTGALKSGKPAPKLKLKLGESKGSAASGMSFLGPYDRELDSDFEEDLVFEEQFILRVPEGEACERIKKLAHDRDAAPDVWFKFRDPRRGVFSVGNTTFQAKLVDLPCVVEAQKTLDKKQLFKVADICQMVVLSTGTEDTDDFKVDDFIWPHGITPPLKHVRKRRFRKRINKRTIETVEQEVERLFETDAMADSVQFDVLEGVNPDLSDSEFMERDDLDHATPAAPEDAATPMGDMDGDEGGDGEEEDEDAMDAEFAAELHRAMEEGSSGEDDAGEDSEPSEDEDGDDDDEDGEDDELEQGRKRLNEEIRDLEAAVAKKHAEIATSANPIVRKRFEDALRKLQSDLEMKQAQRDAITEERARRKELRARAEDGEDVDGDGADDEDEDEGAEEGEVAAGVYSAVQPMDEDVDPIFGGD